MGLGIGISGTNCSSSGGDGGSVGAKLTKTGQTVSYATGDDGDLEEGREVDFFTLSSNNPFGTTSRFTDELGGSTYTNNIVIDWSTYDGSKVLGYYRTTNTATWNNAINNSLSLSVGGFSSGWYLPNKNEMFNLQFVSSSNPFAYSPLNVSSYAVFWTSTTRLVSTSQALALVNNSQYTVTVLSKSTTQTYISARIFTVTGTTLT